VLGGLEKGKPMKQPERIEIDLEAQASYVYYSDADVAETIDVLRDGAVAADLDAKGNVVGIELLGFESDVIECARGYAASHDLGFPPGLNGSFVA
jgi:uncharacterized protein YuzE